MKKNNDIIKNSIMISLVVSLGKVLGFVKQAVIAWAFGANALTDVYFAADGYTSMFGQVLGNSVSPAVLARYVLLSGEGKEKQAKKLVMESLVFFASLGALLALVNILFSSRICDLIGLSYSAAQKEDLHFFLIALCPVTIFTATAGVIGGYLDAHKRFIYAKLCSLFFSCSIIISVLFWRNLLGLRSLLYGFLFGYLAHTVFMVIVARKDFVFQAVHPFRDDEFRALLKKFMPLVLGNSVVDLGLLVDKIIASSLAVSSVSVLYYGQVISSDLVSAVLVSVIGTVLFTSFTTEVAGNNKDRAVITKSIVDALLAMLCITALLCSLYIVEGADLVKLFFERGSFGDTSTTAVAQIAMCYSLGFVFMGWREVLIKAHYAFQDTLTPMINGILGLLCNVAGSLILSRFVGASGIAIATSLAMLCVAVVSTFTIQKHIGGHLLHRSGIVQLLKTILAAVLALLAGIALRAVLASAMLVVRLVVTGCTMAALYGGLALLLRLQAAVNVYQKIRFRKSLENRK